MKWLLLFIWWTCFAQLPTVPDATSAKNAAFTPSSISGLAYAWYEADATNTSSGGLITGNWNDRIQNLPSNQGSLVSTEWKASPQGVWMSGAGGLSNLSITLPNTYSLCYIFRPHTNQNGASDMIIIGNGGANSGMYMNTSGQLVFGGTTVSSKLAYDNNYCVIQTADNGAADGALYTNGVLSANGTFTGQTIHDFGGSANKHSYKGFLFAVLIYTNKIITATDISNLQTWSTSTYTNPPATPPWAPANVPGLVYWLNPTNSLLVNSSGNTLAAEQDSIWMTRTVAGTTAISSNGSGISPAGGGPRLRLTAGANSQAMIGFTNNSFTGTFQLETWAQTNWFFVVINAFTDASTDVLFDGSPNQEQFVMHNGAQYYMYAGSVLSVGLTWPFNGHHTLITAIFNGSNSEIRTNMISAKIGNAGTANETMTQIMGSWTGHIDEFMVYNASEGFTGTSNDIWKVSNYLTNKFNIPNT